MEDLNEQESELYASKCYPQTTCPHPHGHIFHNCLTYINLYIDNRVRQLFARIKRMIEDIEGKGHGPWDFIILRDQSNTSELHKVYIDNGTLKSEPYTEEGN